MLKAGIETRGELKVSVSDEKGKKEGSFVRTLLAC
jgi:hypothetical protein